MLDYILLGVITLLAIYVINKIFTPGPSPNRPSISSSSITAVASKPSSTSTTSKPVEDSKNSGPPVKIFFGSQTGTAEDFALTVRDEAKKNGFNAEVVDLEDFEGEDLEDVKFGIFVVATYGEGEPTDNAKDFYDWLIDDDREEGSLSDVKFTVFGLGNKTYEHYNAMARIFDEKLEKLGATRVHKHGEGDDDGSLEEDFAAWREGLWGPACAAFGLSATQSGEGGHERRYKMLTHDSTTKVRARFTSSNRKASPIDIKNPCLCKVVENRELHAAISDRTCRHIELDIGAGLRYQPGDHIGVYPKNATAVINEIAARVSADLDLIVSLIPADSVDDKRAKPFLGPCTVRQALEQYTDLLTPPRKSVIQSLAHYATDEAEKKALMELASNADPKGVTRYHEWILNDHCTVLEVLNAYKSIDLPIDILLEILPRLNPRYYSISSSLRDANDRVSITSVVVNFTSNTQRVHNGVCSTFLAEKQAEDEDNSMPVFIRTSNFKMPKDPSVPIIMIGPGTGVAPFRGFLQELKTRDAAKRGESVLYFGCRRRDTDYLYKDELESALSEGYLTRLVVAFSREQGEKVYVQNKMAEDEEREDLWRLISAGAHVYVCGDARVMAKDVYNELVRIAQLKGGYLDEEEATKFIQKLKTDARYHEDVWF
eukprot:TRINITY_DN3976_c0_g4_i1.p1 TRINITY_DN3976_c0_g4~~TRINITY_DN3976_c0_g4_i1.p1  ORF type:complete len:697 (-),score=186.72 TRINITY_DN3976_c0_g4_i1:98-2068(-)